MSCMIESLESQKESHLHPLAHILTLLILIEMILRIGDRDKIEINTGSEEEVVANHSFWVEQYYMRVEPARSMAVSA
jgi:hypothetical protein